MMRITVDGVEHDWELLDWDEAQRYKHLQRQLAAFDQKVAEDRKIITDQISDCVARTREKFT